MAPIRVFLADGHPVLLAGLRQLLARAQGLLVVGTAGTAAALWATLPTAAVHVVVLDLNLPDQAGLATLAHLRAHYPAVHVLVLSLEASAATTHALLDAGAAGFLLKNNGIDEIAHGVRVVAAGRPFLCTEVGLAALHELRACRAHAPVAPLSPVLAALTKRETEVLQLVAQGLTTGAIADQLFTSKRTVETHRQNIIEKMQVKNTASLIRLAMSEGMIL